MTDSDIELRRLFAVSPAEPPADDGFVARVVAQLARERAARMRRRRTFAAVAAIGALLLAVFAGSALLQFGASVTHLLTGAGLGITQELQAMLYSPAGVAMLLGLAGLGWYCVRVIARP